MLVAISACRINRTVYKKSQSDLVSLAELFSGELRKASFLADVSNKQVQVGRPELALLMLKTLFADACLVGLIAACLVSPFDDACLLSALLVEHLLGLILAEARHGHGAQQTR